MKKETESLVYPFLFVGLLWAIKYTELYYDLSLGYLGIYPRTAFGLVGIIFSPLIHSGFQHLASNTLPLLILGIIMFNFYRKIAFEVFCWVYLLTGCCVWIIGNEAYHIGSSGLIYGFASFIFISGIVRGKKTTILLSLLIAIVYGGIIYGMLPGQIGISWEGHFYGALTGGLCAYFYRHE